MSYSGVTASLKIGTKTVAYISNFSIEETRDMAEITRFGQTFKEKRPALYNWTASADGTADFATAKGQTDLRDAMINGSPVAVKFYLNTETGKEVYLSGNAYVESFSVDVSSEDRATVSISLSGTDALLMNGAV